MTAQVLPSRSTKVAFGAPRLSASIPAAPLPAKRSRNGTGHDSTSPDSSAPKRDCLTRSDNGRVPSPGAVSRMPAADPAITRPPSGTDRHLVGCQNFAGSDAREPAVRQLSRERIEPRAEATLLVDEFLGLRPRDQRQFAVMGVGQRGDTKRWKATLLETEHFALAAKLEVLLGQDEAVRELHESVEP